MAFRLLAQPLKRSFIPLANSRAGSSASSVTPTIGVDGVATEHHIYHDKIGTREIVGYGYNGLPAYADRIDFPLPAIRWREVTPEIGVSITKRQKLDLMAY